MSVASSHGPLDFVPAGIGPQREQVALIVGRMAAMDLPTWRRIHDASDAFFGRLSADDAWAVKEGRRAAVDALELTGRQDAVQQVGRILLELARGTARDLAPHLTLDGQPAQEEHLPLLRQVVVESLSTASVLALDAVALRDHIGGYGFTQRYYDLLTAPWHRAVGPAHPDDPDDPDDEETTP